ncbi:hypothetical protein JCM19294_1937 [Nonlabens tegetincola]|uniref:Type 1 periplasmic binding fold superfamily protein n=1 Tax=Nonlabens tegetincola TaxID=323273 RepID=A0A090Q004_9FLAO|nr:hypothetical protein [Nonlabens tegetincola]GAK96424.1 hypothetical protein JCM19294_1937 [Nonlabens tegetincola]
MKKVLRTTTALMMTAVLFVSCDNDDDNPDIINPEELITTVELTLTNDNDATDIVVLEAFDEDGEEGPIAPVVRQNGALTANATYSGMVRFLDSSDPADVEDITIEVRAEADEHEVFYVTDVAGVAIAKNDVDGGGNPLGLDTTVTTGAAGSGNFTIVLRHEPTKPNDGTLTGAGGESDIEVTFPLTVQ